jgi:adenylate cyclase
MTETSKTCTFHPDDQSRKPRWIWIWAGVLCLAWSVVAVSEPVWLKRVDMALFDALTRMDQHQPDDTHVVLVDVDETSLAAVGQWPWPRYRLAALVKNLAASNPRAIAMDFFFPEPDRTSLTTIQESFQREFGLDLSVTGIPESMTDNDAYFGHTLAAATSVGAFLLTEHSLGTPFTWKAPSLSLSGDSSGLDPLVFEDLLGNTPVIHSGFARNGFINVRKDPDGILRRLPLLAQYNNQWQPSIVLAALLAAHPRMSLEIRQDLRGPALQMGDLRIPMDEHAQVLLRVARTSETLPVVSSVDVLTGNVDPETIADRIVLVGSSASGLGDLHHTATLSNLPGVAAHAILLQNILSGSHYRPLQWEQNYALVATLISAAVVLIAFLLPGMTFTTMVVCIGLLIFPAMSVISFVFMDLVLPTSAAFLAALSMLLFLSMSFYTVEKRLARARASRLALFKQAMLELMVELAEFRDLETGGHIRRTQLLVKVLAEGLAATGHYPCLDTYYIELLYACAPLHDVGKIAIPDEILHKPGRLDPEEFAIMKQHVIYGRQIIEKLAERIHGDDILTMGLELVATHHERWDGSGYPAGIAGEEIPLSGRIMALADVYDALTSKRVYKKAMPHAKAREIIVNGSGTQFDPAVVRVFLDREETILDILNHHAQNADHAWKP